MTEPLERLQMEVEALKNDLHLQERENLRLRRVIQGLEQAARDRHADRPDAKTVAHLLEVWQTECDHHKCKVPLDGKRAERVRWALKHYSAEYLEQVFQAAGQFPYVWAYKRQRIGFSDQRRTQIETLLKDEKTIENLHALLESEQPSLTVQVPQSTLDKMRQRVKDMEWAVAFYRREALEERETAEAAWNRVAEWEEGRPRLTEVAA